MSEKPVPMLFTSNNIEDIIAAAGPLPTSHPLPEPNPALGQALRNPYVIPGQPDVTRHVAAADSCTPVRESEVAQLRELFLGLRQEVDALNASLNVFRGGVGASEADDGEKPSRKRARENHA